MSTIKKSFDLNPEYWGSNTLMTDSSYPRTGPSPNNDLRSPLLQNPSLNDIFGIQNQSTPTSPEMQITNTTTYGTGHPSYHAFVVSDNIPALVQEINTSHPVQITQRQQPLLPRYNSRKPSCSRA